MHAMLWNKYRVTIHSHEKKGMVRLPQLLARFEGQVFQSKASVRQVSILR